MTATPFNHRLLARRLARVVLAGTLLLSPVALWSTRPAIAADPLTQAEQKFAAERKLAKQVLEQAHARVERAQDNLRVAKVVLDDFVETELKRRAPSALRQPTLEIPPLSQPAENPEVDRITQRLQEATAQHKQLLELYTPMHPEVVQLELRKAELSEQLAELTKDPPVAEPVWPQKKYASAALPNEDLDLHKPEEDAVAKYQEAFEKWQAAHQELQAALLAESIAREKLAAIKLVVGEPSPPAEAPATNPPVASVAPTPRTPHPLRSRPAPQAEPVPHAEPAPVTEDSPAVEPPAVETRIAEAPQSVALPDLTPPSHVQQKKSQPMAFIALLAALALAGLAAIKLARASNEGIFSSADEVGAALALPIVGVIPAMGAFVPKPIPTKPGRRRGKLFFEIGLAIVVFAAVAACVQNPSLFRRVCEQPLQWIDSAAHSQVAE